MTRRKKAALIAASLLAVLAIAAGLVWWQWPPKELPLPGVPKPNHVRYSLIDDQTVMMLAGDQPAATLERKVTWLQSRESSEAVMYGAGGKVYIYDSKGERALPDAVIELAEGVEILPGGEQYHYWGRTQDGEWCYGIGSIDRKSVV